MKLSLTFKDPDVLSEAIYDKRRNLIKQLREELGLSEVGAEAEADERLKGIEEFISDYMPHGEYITIVFDDDELTVEVVK